MGEPSGTRGGRASLDAAIERLADAYDRTLSAGFTVAASLLPAVEELLTVAGGRSEVQETIARLVATLPATEPSGTPEPVVADTTEQWLLDLGAAVERCDRSGIGDASTRCPAELHPRVRTGIEAAARGVWADAEVALVYLAAATPQAEESRRFTTRVAAATTTCARLAVRRLTETPGELADHVATATAFLEAAAAIAGTSARHQAALADLELAQGNVGAALEAAERASELDPDFPRGHVELARAVEASGGDATEHHDTAAFTAATWPDPLGALGDLGAATTPAASLLALGHQLAANDHPDAEECLRAATVVTDDPDADPKAGFAVRSAAHEALARLRRARRDPDAAADLYEAVVDALDAEDIDRAGKVLDELESWGSQRPEVPILVAEVMRYLAEVAGPRRRDPDLLVRAARALEDVTATGTAEVRAWSRRVAARVALLTATGSGTPVEHLVDALLAAEEAVALAPGIAEGYLRCAQAERRLGWWACAWHDALDASEADDASDEAALEPAIIALQAGAVHEARRRFDERVLDSDLGRATTIAAIREVIAVLASDGDVPTPTLEALSGTPDAEVGVETALAVVLRRRGNFAGVAEQDRRVWQARDTADPEDLTEVARAGLRLGRIEEALAVLETWAHEPVDATGVRLALALARLQNGDPEAGPEVLDAIDAEAQPGALWSLDLDLDALAAAAAERSPSDPMRAAVGSVVVEARNRLARHRARGPRLDDIDAELTGHPDDRPGTVSTAWHARRARRAVDGRDWGGALAHYRELGELGRVSLADAGRRRVAQEASADVRAALAITGPTEHALAAAADAANEVADEQVRSDVATLACVAAAGDARDPLPDLLRLGLPVDPSPDAVLAVLWELLPSEGHRPVLDRWRAGVRRAGPGRGDTGLVAATLERDHALRKAQLAGETAFAAFDTRPIEIELGAHLIHPEDTGSSWKLFASDVPAMRERAERLLGLRMPGVRFRGNPDLPPDDYTVLVHGLVEERGRLTPSGGPSWQRLEPVVAGVIRAALRDPTPFVTIDTVAAEILAILRQPTARLDALAPMLDGLADRRRTLGLVRLVRQLALDGVRAGDWAAADVVGALRARVPGVGDALTAASAGHVAEAADLLRPRLRDRLVGNGPGAVRLRVPPELVDRLVGTGLIDGPLCAVDPGARAGAQDTMVTGLVVDTDLRRRALQDLVRREGAGFVVLTEAESRGPVREWPSERDTVGATR